MKKGLPLADIKEIKCLLALLGTKTGNNIDMVLDGLNLRDLNWERVFTLAIEQRVFALIYLAMKRSASGRIPDGIFERFKTAYVKVHARNFYLEYFLLNLLEDFKGNGIFVLPFKGPVTARQVYQNSGARPYSDLDILISKKDLLPAVRLLEQQGCIPDLPLNGRQLKCFREWEDHLVFWSKNQVCIELHWELSGMYLSTPLFLEDIKHRLCHIGFHKKELPCLSNEDHLIHACIHGTRHGWEHLEQVYSIASIVNQKTLDWVLITKLASNYRCKRMLTLGLYLSWLLFDAKLPDHFIKVSRNNPSLQELARESVNRILTSKTGTEEYAIEQRFSLYHLRTRDRMADRIRYLTRLVFGPTDKEFKAFHLPSGFHWLMYCLRPFRLVLTYFHSKRQNA